MIRFRILFPIMAVITLFAIMAPPILGITAAIFTYHGLCYGFTDGSWPCTWGEYATDAAAWSTLLDIPLGMYLLPSWLVALGIWLFRRTTPDSSKLPFYQVILIPIGGYIIGFCLISIMPIFIRFFDSLIP